MRYNCGFIKNCNNIRSNNTGSEAVPQLPEAKEVWYYDDIYIIFPIKQRNFGILLKNNRF